MNIFIDSCLISDIWVPVQYDKLVPNTCRAKGVIIFDILVQSYPGSMYLSEWGYEDLFHDCDKNSQMASQSGLLK